MALKKCFLLCGGKKTIIVPRGEREERLLEGAGLESVILDIDDDLKPEAVVAVKEEK